MTSVLFVEDDDATALAYSTGLSKTGKFTVNRVSGLRDAVEALASITDVDIVLCRCMRVNCNGCGIRGMQVDLVLPDSASPDETVNTIMRLTSVPVVILSGMEGLHEETDVVDMCFSKSKTTPLDLAVTLEQVAQKFNDQTMFKIKGLVKSLSSGV